MSVACRIVLALAEVTAQQPQPSCRAAVRTRIQSRAHVHDDEPVWCRRVWKSRTDRRRPKRSETEFELILSVDLPTRVSWLGFTVEAIFLPFERDSTPELEFETNFTWLPSERTGGWLSSHFDVVDKFSAAERPSDRRAYTHKLNFELDTSFALFNWMPEGRWLRGVELEGSLDYVATGLPKAGDRVGGVRFVDDASPWSFSLVFVLPIAPF